MTTLELLDIPNGAEIFVEPSADPEILAEDEPLQKDPGSGDTTGKKNHPDKPQGGTDVSQRLTPSKPQGQGDPSNRKKP